MEWPLWTAEVERYMPSGGGAMSTASPPLLGIFSLEESMQEELKEIDVWSLMDWMASLDRPSFQALRAAAPPFTSLASRLEWLDLQRRVVVVEVA